MFCSKCGVENSDISKFCKSCGSSLQQDYSQESNHVQANSSKTEQPDERKQYQQPFEPVKKPKKKKKKGCLVSIFILLAVFLVFIIAAVMNGGEVSFSTANFQDTVMASEIDPATSEPLVTTDVFPQSSNIIYVTTYVKNVPAGTKISCVWTYVPSGETLEGDPVVLDEDAQIQFNVTMPSGFMSGEYKVDLLINDEVKETLPFTVE